jgi:hypothetical protein
MEAALKESATEEKMSHIVMGVWKAAFCPFSDGDIEKRRPVLRQVVQRIVTNRVTGTR